MRLNKKKVSFLISGKGSNIYKILIKNLKNEKFYIISIVSNNLISDEIKKIVKKNEYKINLFEKVPSLKSNYFKGTDVIFSVGYIKIINSKLIDKDTIINLHTSILPNSKGFMTKKRMWLNHEKDDGITIQKKDKT